MGLPDPVWVHRDYPARGAICCFGQGGWVGLRCSDAPPRPHEAGIAWPAELAGVGAARDPSGEQSSACAPRTVAARSVAVPAPPRCATQTDPAPGWTHTISGRA